MKTRMRMLKVHHRQLRGLLEDRTREQACFLLCSDAQGDNEKILLVNEVIPLTSADLNVHRPDQLSVSPTAMLRVARMAQKSKRAICMVHTHPMSVEAVGFSTADDDGNVRTFEFFHRMAPNLPHSCLVWGGTLKCCAGRLYETSLAWTAIDSISVMNDTNLRVFRERSNVDGHAIVGDEFDRQVRLIGPAGQVAISRQRVSIAGCGGIGSVATQALGHAGVRDFQLVDEDIQKKENLPRNLGATPADVIARRLKVEVAARYLKECFPSARVTVLPTAIEDTAILPKLISSDFIVCGTDDTTSRAYLNQICNQYYVPILDLGVQFAVDQETGALVREIGKVNLVLPGEPCMLCSQHIHPKVLHDEGLSSEQRVAQANYIDGADEPEPSMMVFNLEVVARGLQLFTYWVTGLTAVDTQQYERIHFLGLGAPRGVRNVKKTQRPDCPYCSDNSPIRGVGDREPMWVRRRPRNVA